MPDGCRPRSWSSAGRSRDTEELDDRRATIVFSDAVARVEREPAQALFRFSSEPTLDALVHPYLAPVAGLFAHWRGYEAFHAGAFVLDGGVGLVADRGVGKSSTLARLALDGIPIVADDLLVIDEIVALAGPARSISATSPLEGSGSVSRSGSSGHGAVGASVCTPFPVRPRTRLGLPRVARGRGAVGRSVSAGNASSGSESATDDPTPALRSRPSSSLQDCPASSSGAREHGACSARRRACCSGRFRLPVAAEPRRLEQRERPAVGHVGGPGGAHGGRHDQARLDALPAPPGGDVAGVAGPERRVEAGLRLARVDLRRQERAEDRVEPPSPCATVQDRLAREGGTSGSRNGWATTTSRAAASAKARGRCAQRPWAQPPEPAVGAAARLAGGLGRPGLGERGPACGAEPEQPEWTPAPPRSSAERAWRKSEREAAKIAAAGANAAGRDVGEPVPPGRRERLVASEPGEDRALRGRARRPARGRRR